MHVVISTDNREVVEAVRRSLPDDGDRHSVCESGLELLAAVGALAVDLVVVDVETPGMNASLLISAIQEVAPGLPIVAVAPGGRGDLRALLEKGVHQAALRGGKMDPLLAELLQPSGRAVAARAE